MSLLQKQDPFQAFFLLFRQDVSLTVVERDIVAISKLLLSIQTNLESMKTDSVEIGLNAKNLSRMKLKENRKKLWHTQVLALILISVIIQLQIRKVLGSLIKICRSIKKIRNLLHFPLEFILIRIFSS